MDDDIAFCISFFFTADNDSPLLHLPQRLEKIPPGL